MTILGAGATRLHPPIEVNMLRRLITWFRRLTELPDLNFGARIDFARRRDDAKERQP